MRRLSGLLLLAMAGILAAVGVQYMRAKAAAGKNPTQPPTPLRAGIEVSSPDWVYRKESGNCPQMELRSREMESAGQPASKLFLKKVQLRLFHKCGETYDFIRSESAEFDKASGRMFSGGEVEITLAVKNTVAGTVAGMLDETQEQPGRLLNIKATGVSVDVASGKATTEKKATFQFDLGFGDAVGASYNPETRELELLSDVHLTWKGRDPKPNQKPMLLEAGKLVYKEVESKVYLSPWAKLKRDGLTLESETADVLIKGGAIRLVEAAKAHGVDELPKRKLTYAADALTMNLNEKSVIEKIAGTGHARLETTSPTGRTIVTTDRIDLEFEVAPEEGSLLKVATASGPSTVESRPAAGTASARILKAESIVTRMRAGGEEVEIIETHTPGTLDLLPATPAQPRRHLKAERMWMTYGAKNQLQSFRAVQTAAETYKPRRPRDKADPPPAYTWSRDLTAEFHPESGDVTKLEQWDEFRYKEGEREARAGRATLEVASNLITLLRAEQEPARSWDPAGSVTADQILMNQQSGDFQAEGKVSSTRLPDRKQAANGSMLNQDEPLQATSDRMTTAGENKRIVYDGNASLWQSANRLQASRVTIDRDAKTLTAEGKVVSQILDKKPNPRTGRTVNTVVRAEKLVYNDTDRLAHYTGGSRLIRDHLDVKSKELRAWLSKEGQDGGGSSLDRAFADGSAEIFMTLPDRARRGSADHAEYFVAHEKVVLNGGIAQMIDSVDGTTRAKQLTYYAASDALEVEGALTQPAVSRIRRK